MWVPVVVWQLCLLLYTCYLLTYTVGRERWLNVNRHWPYAGLRSSALSIRLQAAVSLVQWRCDGRLFQASGPANQKPCSPRPRYGLRFLVRWWFLHNQLGHFLRILFPNCCHTLHTMHPLRAQVDMPWSSMIWYIGTVVVEAGQMSGKYLWLSGLTYSHPTRGREIVAKYCSLILLQPWSCRRCQ